MSRPIEESLRLFEDMKNGKFAANEATLRMKMDMLSPNPNMWDQVSHVYIRVLCFVAHRVRFSAYLVGAVNLV